MPTPLRPAFPTRAGLPRRAALPAVALAGLLALAPPAGAQGVAGGPAATAATPAAAAAPAAAPAADIGETTRRWLDQEVARAQPGAGVALRMEVAVGTLDERLRLAPCARVEPYVPPGARLWGRSRLGLRCVDGPVRWNVFLPVTVKAFGPAWVARAAIAPGTALSAGDAVQGEADWAEDPSPVLGDSGQWVGTTAVRPLAAGQPLRQASVRAAQVFAAGTQVRIVAQGPGFAVVSDAQALAPGVVGQPVRVRVDGGRMMNGTVLDAHTVKLDI